VIYIIRVKSLIEFVMEELVYSPILNYVQSNLLNGIDNDTIKKYGIDFLMI